jgi:hypothetical protein
MLPVLIFCMLHVLWCPQTCDNGYRVEHEMDEWHCSGGSVQILNVADLLVWYGSSFVAKKQQQLLQKATFIINGQNESCRYIFGSLLIMWRYALSCNFKSLASSLSHSLSLFLSLPLSLSLSAPVTSRICVKLFSVRNEVQSPLCLTHLFDCLGAHLAFFCEGQETEGEKWIAI